MVLKCVRNRGIDNDARINGKQMNRNLENENKKIERMLKTEISASNLQCRVNDPLSCSSGRQEVAIY